MNLRRFQILSLCLVLGLTSALFAQTSITGELAGTVSDVSGAVVANATVTLKSADTGTAQTTTTNQSGYYRFTTLRPGDYTLAITAAGFAPATRNVVVSLGQVNAVNVNLAVKGTKEVVEVTAAAPMIQTENANLTTNYSAKSLELQPNPGGDMNMVALTAPGIIISTGAGYGNFSANGLPGVSNVFTVNGTDNNDPTNGLANSGSSNSTLGANEVQELTVTTNGYSVQYGRSAAATLNASTKSGSNSFHGNASWDWNGRAMNANEWFNNNSGTPRNFANSNQWAGSIGGPIVKNKLFFFFDSEGLRYVLPAGGTVYTPTPQFQASTLAYVTANNPAMVPLYTKAFQFYNNSPGHAGATPISMADEGYCDSLVGQPVTDINGVPTGGTFGVDTACAQQHTGFANALNKERLMAIRIDWNAAANDKFSFRYWQDRGIQATGTSLISPLFNRTSPQPQDTGQLTWTKIINPRMVNQLILAASHYSAIFDITENAAAHAALPTEIRMAYGEFNTVGPLGNYPQGRNVNQWQIIDDFSWTKGDHTLKFGVNNKHNMFADFTPFRYKSGYISFYDTADFFTGFTDNGSRIYQNFSPLSSVVESFNSLDMYAQDEWRVNNKLRLTLGVRASRNSNMTCRTDCYSRFENPFTSLANHTGAYNKDLITGLHEALPGIEPIAFQPRFGFAYSPSGNDKTVIRGGFGLFTDIYPLQMGQSFITNPPVTAAYTITTAGISVAPCVGGFAWGSTTTACPATDAWTRAANSYRALSTGYSSGADLAGMNAIAGFSVSTPNMTAPPSRFLNPKYLQWNLEIERALGSKMAVTANYVGNHGYDLILQNGAVNTYCAVANCLGGLFPTAKPDTRFASVDQYTNNGKSFYNGLTLSLVRRLTKGFNGRINYTWSHATDNISNAGLQPFDYSNNTSMLYQFHPTNPNYGWGNADYDFRHSLSATYSWELPFKSTNGALNQVVNGWTVSGTFFARSGKPLTALGRPASYLGNTSYMYVLSEFKGGPIPSCDYPGADTSHQCLTADMFTPYGAQTTLGFGRNMFRGPKYVNGDMSVNKKFKLTESGAAISFGITAYNFLNHPNFDNPYGSISSSSLGYITQTIGPPSSPYGNFQGGVANGRLLLTNIKFSF